MIDGLFLGFFSLHFEEFHEYLEFADLFILLSLTRQISAITVTLSSDGRGKPRKSSLKYRRNINYSRMIHLMTTYRFSINRVWFSCEDDVVDFFALPKKVFVDIYSGVESSRYDGFHCKVPIIGVSERAFLDCAIPKLHLQRDSGRQIIDMLHAANVLIPLNDINIPDVRQYLRVVVAGPDVIFGNYFTHHFRRLEVGLLQEGSTCVQFNQFLNALTLKMVELPDSLDTINMNSFSGCIALEKINFPEGLRVIRETAFNTCRALRHIDLPDSLECIGSCAFSGCDNLESVSMGRGLKTLSWSAFHQCKALPAIDLPDGVTLIQDGAFYRCLQLERVYLGQSITQISAYCFFGCESLRAIRIPDLVLSIEEKSFAGCVSLEDVSLGHNLQAIGSLAFQGCMSLRRINLPASLRVIGEGAFQGCSALEVVSVHPDSLSEICRSAFLNCESLVRVEGVLGESIYIGERAFAGCANLQTSWKGELLKDLADDRVGLFESSPEGNY
jgi:hypothetical protein